MKTEQQNGTPQVEVNGMGQSRGRKPGGGGRLSLSGSGIGIGLDLRCTVAFDFRHGWRRGRAIRTVRTRRRLKRLCVSSW